MILNHGNLHRYKRHKFYLLKINSKAHKITTDNLMEIFFLIIV